MNLQNQEYKLIGKSLNVSVANTDLTLKINLIPDAKMLILFAKKTTATDKIRCVPYSLSLLFSTQIKVHIYNVNVALVYYMKSNPLRYALHK